ncbi:MAG: hypothetical protein HWQ44_23635 [Nostoc sp. JL34]|uniref:hypothetical protein n=1 Tax=Nostoc sp. JL34 TaxID=2815397 RepID=UPI001D26CA36|nr:hypothetical protein [Nostoc sp. JL34]MBN3885832.1 hypothetical protein [Nostoc sp. JL34]
MSLSFTFALSQQQTFELRCNYGSRRLDKTELAALIDLCGHPKSDRTLGTILRNIRADWRCQR